MPVRLVDGASASIERWLANVGAPAAQEPEHATRPDGSPGSSAEAGFKCPVCDAPRQDYGSDRERYDEDYDYYWGSVRMPLWFALIWQVPWRQRLEIFVVGFIIGMLVAGGALLWGLLLSHY